METTAALDAHDVHPRRRRRWVGPLLVLVAVVSKLKIVLLLLGKAKFLTTGLTMVVSVGAYALLWGWSFALGFVLLLFVHEMGHVIQLRREGVEASAPMFIPFLGAVVVAKSMGRDAAAEARVGLAGPILGSLGCLVPIAMLVVTGAQFWSALAFVGLFVNLFNLVPLVPFDGGRAMAALSPRWWLLGLLAMLAVAVATANVIVGLFALLGGAEAWRRWKGFRSGDERAYYAIPTRQRVAVGLVYFSLVIVLVVGMHFTFIPSDQLAR